MEALQNKDIRKFYEREVIRNTECPITDALISAGYVQESNGYISYAKECGVISPTQYWHLIKSYSYRTNLDENFTRRIQCGELVFWMTEVAVRVSMPEEEAKETLEKLNTLKNKVLDNYINNRREGNKEIQKVCWNIFPNIVKKYVEKHKRLKLDIFNRGEKKVVAFYNPDFKTFSVEYIEGDHFLELLLPRPASSDDFKEFLMGRLNLSKNVRIDVELKNYDFPLNIIDYTKGEKYTDQISIIISPIE